MEPSFIVQARMGSSRLPNKIMLPFFKGKCILELLIEKLREVPNTKIIIATSINPDNNIIEEFCDNHGINCYRGDENDVIQRFIDAAEKFNVEKIIRVCSDNPFLELDSLNILAEKAQNSLADYISFNINGIPSIKTHFGFWAEYTTLSTLKQVRQITNELIYHEHVTNFIYSHPEKFQIEWIPGPKCLNDRSDIRLTCDTLEDFQNTKEIFADICNEIQYPYIETLVQYLDEHVEYTSKMKEQILLNSK
ncbi:MAG: glycosyl transferase family 2 [Bacteroides sp.]|nr:glycosyl transferase family 2 [Bacteroides sp.]